MTGIAGDEELELYLAANVYVADGNLVLATLCVHAFPPALIRHTRYQPTMYGSREYAWTSGWVDTQHKFWQQFGRFEIVARLPCAWRWRMTSS